ncbi:MAG TPA: LacI family DNA-binding transcriptional regulator [Gemmatimonadaceae bacterium]|nr:LacI family DNA-binding transcriptional regulator [Gemmatimonadaceae bacterium]
MVTIKDVAREAGVSVATVSRVHNRRDVVNEDTRRRVAEVAARLGYSPHGAARSLITSETNTIGVLLPDLYGEFFSEVIRGIDQTAQRHGYHLLISSSHDEEREIDAALRSMRGRVDGLIVMAPRLGAREAVANLADDFPLVLLNCAVDDAPFDAITVGNFDGARAMVRHLVALGHRRVAIITGAERNYDAAERRRGYRDALREAGIKPHAAWEARGDFGEESGYRAAQQLLAARPRPTAIFAANDAMAIGALSALRESGVRVPEDVAVAGFDDIPMARYMSPPLSSVHVDISALGEHATTRLVESVRRAGRRERPREGRHETMPTWLVVRDSCGGVRAAAAASTPPPKDGRPTTTATGRRAAGGRRRSRAEKKSSRGTRRSTT